MMLVDSSFIIQLLRDLSQNQFKLVPSLSRWMLPTIGRSWSFLKTRFHQLIVLNKFFELIDNNSFWQPSMSLNDLAFWFFYHLLQPDSTKIPECQNTHKFLIQHVLDLLRNNICRFTPEMHWFCYFVTLLVVALQ